MQFTTAYDSPLGKILLAADDIGLCGVWFEGQKFFARTLSNHHEEKKLPIFDETKRWLDIYFSGNEPKFFPKLHLIGTPFQMIVWNFLRQIPYGEVVTYGDLAKKFQKNFHKNMAAQAIGSAVGHNPISILIPCHRVLGKNKKLVGYAGGIDKKIKLLSLEGIEIKNDT